MYYHIIGMKTKKSLNEKHQPPYRFLAKDILRYLAVGMALMIVLSSPVGTRRLLKDIKKEWRKKNALRTIDSLYRNNLIFYREKHDGTRVITITQAGKKKVKEWNVEDMKIMEPTQWDKRWRVVTFDIKEDRKKARDALRHVLGRLGFYRLQRSVFIHPYSCRAEIEFLCNAYDLSRRDVLYFSTDRIPNEALLKKHFKL